MYHLLKKNRKKENGSNSIELYSTWRSNFEWEVVKNTLKYP